jgi:hypothetical protein
MNLFNLKNGADLRIERFVNDYEITPFTIMSSSQRFYFLSLLSAPIFTVSTIIISSIS